MPCLMEAICIISISLGIDLSAADLSLTNPIGKIARLFNPKLVKMEDRVEFLNRRLSSLAVHKEISLKFGMGARCVRFHATDPDPSLTVDLGREVPVDKIFLVPLQMDSSDNGRLFPGAFRIELSNSPDFHESRVLFDTKSGGFSETGGKPVKLSGKGWVARFVRITVNHGQVRGGSLVFGLSELVVISDGYPVSFGCKVSSVGAIRVKDLWYPEALTDGRMPLGTWQGANWAPPTKKKEYIEASSPGVIEWSIKLGTTERLDMLYLFPVEIREMLEANLLPEKIEVQVMGGDSESFTTVSSWEYPLKGISHSVPLVLNLGGILGNTIRIKGMEPSMLGNKAIFGLSEIQIWSDRRNITGTLPVRVGYGGNSSDVAYLTDGFASEREIIPVASWLNQLHERWFVEQEIGFLRPMNVQMAAESELNATWGSAMMLGLTFLIPVFIIERRRLISRDQIDQLRKRIASDLHDDIGSNLGSISLIARTARKDLIRLHGPEAVGLDLGEVESIARESSLAMRDIVWLLERSQDSIGDLVHRMRETASRLLREVEYSIECDSGKVASKLSLDAKRHLFLFYKEAIHNVLKHSGATNVVVRLWDEGDRLALEVIDNGHGLPKIVENDGETTKPIRKLDERARLLEGDLVIQSDSVTGTRVLLSVKRSALIAAPAIK